MPVFDFKFGLIGEFRFDISTYFYNWCRVSIWIGFLWIDFAIRRCDYV